MYSNNIVNFQECTTILNAYTKKSLETYMKSYKEIKYKRLKEYALLLICESDVNKVYRSLWGTYIFEKEVFKMKRLSL